MKPLAKGLLKAFTLLELLAVLCAIGVVAFFLFAPRMTVCKAKAPQINCVNNLKQVGLSFRLWAGDHGDKLPMEVSVADGGTMEYVAQGVVFPHFTVMSNELGTPKIVACPADKKRTVATNFVSLADANVSYFVCLNARGDSSPEMWLAGDWNVRNRFVPIRGVLHVPTNSPVRWTDELHNAKGNLTLADGSVQQLSCSALNRSLTVLTNTPLRLAMPE